MQNFKKNYTEFAGKWPRTLAQANLNTQESNQFETLLKHKQTCFHVGKGSKNKISVKGTYFTFIIDPFTIHSKHVVSVRFEKSITACNYCLPVTIFHAIDLKKRISSAMTVNIY
ncbi:hypothetical protein Tsp_03097 [Trichinella spiralis]|uniref:hypothetical protein n=1 Tax=Trichinella spiralis TaxID=6334 RepID=UPI0001EFB9D7|nr:hypothetical protein Tsp_03097 [Trichinella spiralis]